MLIQLLLFVNFYLSLLFSKQISAFLFLFVRKSEAFEGAQQQSSSRLIKGFFSLFSFFKLLQDCVVTRHAYFLYFFFEGNLFEKKTLENLNKIEAQVGIENLLLQPRALHCKLLNHSTFPNLLIIFETYLILKYLLGSPFRAHQILLSLIFQNILYKNNTYLLSLKAYMNLQYM